MITSNTLLVPRIESRIQVIRGVRVMLDEKADVVANCDHLQNLKFSKAFMPHEGKATTKGSKTINER